MTILLRPETPLTRTSAQISASDSTISVSFPEIIEKFNDGVKAMGYHWERPVWYRKIGERAGAVESRMVELGCHLLALGFCVEMPTDELAARADYVTDFTQFADVLFKRIEEVASKTTYIEIGNQNVDDFENRLGRLYPHIQRFPVTYYRQHPMIASAICVWGADLLDLRHTGQVKCLSAPNSINAAWHVCWISSLCWVRTSRKWRNRYEEQIHSSSIGQQRPARYLAWLRDHAQRWHGRISCWRC